MFLWYIVYGHPLHKTPPQSRVSDNTLTELPAESETPMPPDGFPTESIPATDRNSDVDPKANPSSKADEIGQYVSDQGTEKNPQTGTSSISTQRMRI